MNKDVHTLVKQYFELNEENKILFHFKLDEQYRHSNSLKFDMLVNLQPLGKEFEDILHDNAWSLYER